MSVINNKKNFDDVYIRMVGVALCKTLTRAIRWINYFEDKKIRVLVPFYLSMSGSDRFLLDAYIDDISSARVELNTDQIPRGVITMTSFSTSNEEYANPNQYLAKKIVLNDKLQNLIMKTKAIPCKFNYDIEIVIDNEIDSYKCSEKIINMFFNYMFFNIDYYGMKIDAVFELPDDKEITLPRDISLDSDTKKTLKFSLRVSSYYPSFIQDTDDLEVCDNDDTIDWERLEIPKPIDNDYLKNNTIKRVLWENYIWNTTNIDSPKDETKRQFPNKSDGTDGKYPKENF